jgi:hypothetical protein
MKGSNRCPVNGLHVTLWAKWAIEGDLTIRESVDAAKGKYDAQWIR